MGRYADFRRLTEEALDSALAQLGTTHEGLREALMGLYDRLHAYPEVRQMLASLRERRMRLAILSNGSPAMLDSAVEAAGLGDWFDAVLSAREVRTDKPHPEVYALGARHLGLPAERILFVSSNGWDAFAARAFGFRAVWCNRSGRPPERIPASPDAEIGDLRGLLPLLTDG